MGNVFKIERNITKDNLTNEILEDKEKVSQFYKESEPPFIKVYLDRITQILNLPGAFGNILLGIAVHMPYANDNQQYFIVNSFIKKSIAESLGVTEGYINDAITLFVKKRILIRVSRGTYKMNPFIIAKGKWEDIRELRLTLSYSEHGEKIESLHVSLKDGTEKIIADGMQL